MKFPTRALRKTLKCTSQRRGANYERSTSGSRSPRIISPDICWRRLAIQMTRLLTKNYYAVFVRIKLRLGARDDLADSDEQQQSICSSMFDADNS